MLQLYHLICLLVWYTFCMLNIINHIPNIINCIDFKQLHNVIIGMLTILISLFIFIFGQYNDDSKENIAFREIIIDSIKWKSLIVYIPISLFLLALANVPFLVIRIIILLFFIFSVVILYRMLSFLFHLVLSVRFQLSKKLLKKGASFDKKVQFWKDAVWIKQWSLEEEEEFKKLFLKQFDEKLNLIIKDKPYTRNNNYKNIIKTKKLLDSFYSNLEQNGGKIKHHLLQAEDIFLEIISIIDFDEKKMDYLQTIFKLSFKEMLKSFEMSFKKDKEIGIDDKIEEFIIDILYDKYKKSENFMIKKILEILEENNGLSFSKNKKIIIEFIERELLFKSFSEKGQNTFIENLSEKIDRVIEKNKMS